MAAPHSRRTGSALAMTLILTACANTATVADVAEPSPVATAVTVVESGVADALAVFYADSRSDNTEALVAAMTADGDTRWAPWLIDLLRFGSSNRLAIEIADTLETMSGIESTQRIPNMNAYGSWAQSLELDGGEGYREFKARLYGRIDAEFEPLVASVVEQAQVAAIQWGGVPRGGIPELNDPERVPVSDADWMVADEVVLGVTANGESVAYPLRIIARHELVNDTVGGDQLAIVYCTLCRSGLVYERVIDGQLLNFQTSGLLLNSNKIMVDRETDTLWHHLEGAAIGGELLGTDLVLRSNQLLRWSDWVAQFPDSEVLTLPSPIFFDDPERPPIAYDYSPGTAYESYYSNPDVWFPILETPDTFDIKAEVIGIEHNGDSFALNAADLNTAGVTVEVEIGGAVFSFEPTGVGAIVRDAQGTVVPAEQSFWFAWFANHPETRTAG